MRQNQLLANIVKIDITPLPEHFRTMQPDCGGNSEFRNVAHPVAACVTVFETDGTGLLIIALDAWYIDETSATLFKERFAAETGIPPDHILLCASHSHSVPCLVLDATWVAWTKWVLERLCTAVREAWMRRRPARAGVGYGYHHGVCFNQRMPHTDSHVKFVRNHIEGRLNPRPIDPRVGVLRIDDASGNLMGALINFAAHPATLIPYPKMNYSDINPDYPGFLSRYVERRRQGVLVGFLQGACGDINIDYMFTTLGAAEYTGSLLGKEVDRVLDDIATSEHFPIRVLKNTYRLPLEDMPSEEEVAEWQHGCDEYLTRAADDPTQLWVNGLNMTEYVSAETRIAMVQKLRKWCDWIREHRDEIAGVRDYQYEQVVARLGDLVIVFHPFEAFVEIGLEVQRLSPCRHTWLVGYTNGANGYLPTADEYRRGGYEVKDRRYAQNLHEEPLNLAEHADAVFLDHAIAAIREVWQPVMPLPSGK